MHSGQISRRRETCALPDRGHSLISQVCFGFRAVRVRSVSLATELSLARDRISDCIGNEGVAMSSYWANALFRISHVLLVALVALALGGAAFAAPAPVDPLIKAAAEGDLAAVRTLLMNGADPDVRGFLNMTPLTFASESVGRWPYRR
jgi:hypothetical protein